MLGLFLGRELARQFSDLGGQAAALRLLRIIELFSLAGRLSHNERKLIDFRPQRKRNGDDDEISDSPRAADFLTANVLG